MTDAEWYARLESLERKMARFHEVEAGQAKLVKVWREGYRERKVRVVAGHYIRLVRSLDWRPRRRK